MSERALRFRVGLFVLIMLTLLGGLIVLFGGYPTLLKRHQRYGVLLGDAAGVSSGTPVRRAGVRIGEVQAVRLDDATGRVHVNVLIEQPHFLRRNDRASIVRSLIGGDATIDFETDDRDVDQTPAAPDTEFVAGAQAKTPGLPQVELIPGVQATIKEFNRSLEQVNRLVPQVEGTLKEYRELAKGAHALLPEIRKMNEEYQTAARSWGKAGDNITAVLARNEQRLGNAVDTFQDAGARLGKVFSDENQKNMTEGIKSFRAATVDVASAMKNIDEFAKNSRLVLQRVDQSFRLFGVVVTNLQQASQPWTERSGNIAKNMDEGAANFNRTFSESRQMFRALGEGEGTLKLLLNDATLYHQLNDAACMMTRILPRLDRALRDLEIFADKVARHPEILGAVGIFQPSTGLKK